MRKQVLVTVDRGETRVAMLEAPGDPVAAKSATGPSAKALDKDFRVAEVYFERRGGRSIVGNIYKGKVDNVLPGLEAAFVDIGLEKNGFLHVDEIVLPGVEPVKRGRGQNGGKQRSIADLLKPGQEIVCQVVKDPLKTKGARVSMELTIAGRYMVFAPTGEGVGVSRRLEDSERERLRKEVKGLDLHGGGAIVRTAAHGAKREAFQRELLYLDKLNEVLSKRVAEAAAPALVFQEADLSIRVVRDIFSAHFERAVVDDEKQHQRLVSFFTRTAPELVDRVELWKPQARPLFEAFGADDVIEGMLSRRVDLPSGGYLVIDYAEALTVIDVNSGSFIGRGKQARLEDTITKTNLEAADEVVNQLRLRDIGGIIVIDFIDMARARNRDAVLKVLRKALDEDRTKTFVVEISPLGLVEMTRQNVTDGVREIMTRPCPTCDGEGVIKSEETIAIEVERRLRELVKDAGEDGPGAYLIRINPRVTAQFIGNGAWMLRELEAETRRYFHFEGSEGLPLDHFAVTLEGTREEVAEQAVPFREGEEVHVHIVEPHMYEVDDAVAKLDGYIISVSGAGRFVGQKRLVRIEEAGRTSATAELIDVTDEERAAMEAETSRAPGASGPGRGRRGGRGRGTTTSRRRSSGAARAGKAEQAEAAVTDDDQGADPVGQPVASEGSPELLEGVAGEQADASVQAPDDSSLPDDDGDAAGDVLESKSRRRGRRGGRRRSRAKSDEADAAAASPDPTD